MGRHPFHRLRLGPLEVGSGEVASGPGKTKVKGTSVVVVSPAHLMRLDWIPADLTPTLPDRIIPPSDLPPPFVHAISRIWPRRLDSSGH